MGLVLVPLSPCSTYRSSQPSSASWQVRGRHKGQGRESPMLHAHAFIAPQVEKCHLSKYKGCSTESGYRKKENSKNVVRLHQKQPGSTTELRHMKCGQSSADAKHVLIPLPLLRLSSQWGRVHTEGDKKAALR